jgi:hypothetical protein
MLIMEVTGPEIPVLLHCKLRAFTPWSSHSQQGKSLCLNINLY